jgi:formylglycine-generating enzyme
MFDETLNKPVSGPRWRIATCVLIAIAHALFLPVCRADELADGHSNSTGMKFAPIPGGEFMMGRERPYSEIMALTTVPFGVDLAIEAEVPQHRVRIAPFLIATNEVSQKQWEHVMGTRPWHNKHPYVNEGEHFPAVYVTWELASEFCQRLSEKDGRAYRLPTEAEWEYACRAQTTTLYSFGDDSSEMPDYGWISGNASTAEEKYAQRVARRKPNGWGLYDMHGNVWEWCSDWYGNSYYSVSAIENPEGPATGTERVIRGGSWQDSDTHARSAFRYGLPPTHADMNIGFRVVCDASAHSDIK